jgi:hypothetical protein
VGVDQGQSNDPENCAIGLMGSLVREGGINRYLPCTKLNPPYPYYDNSCLSLYTAASPYDVVNGGFIYPPPTYLANGGGPTPGVSPPELSALQEAVDFSSALLGHVDNKLCVVDTTHHGTHLLGDICENDPPNQNVGQSTDLWLAIYVCDPSHPCDG